MAVRLFTRRQELDGYLTHHTTTHFFLWAG